MSELNQVPNIAYLNGFNGNTFLEKLDMITRALIHPYRVFLDRCMSCLFLTTEEKKQPFWIYMFPSYFFFFPINLVLTVALIPLTVVAFITWVSFQRWKLPYRISISDIKNEIHTYDSQRTLSFLNANVCLLPEFLSRINNLTDVNKRAKIIGNIIVESQQKAKDVRDLKSHKTSVGNHPLSNGYCNSTSPARGGSHSEFDTSILDCVPMTDFLLLTEGAWDMINATTISQELHKIYPYVIYDIAAPGVWSNYGIGTSGLLFASKFPLENVDFSAYTSSCKQCVFASKGLLQVKVFLGKNGKGNNVCGFFFATHLQVYQGDQPIQYTQMTEAVKWMQTFRETHTSKNDIIAFDVFAGDLNLDNLSPADRVSREHELFTIYRDLGRMTSGQDHHWARGTEMRQALLHDNLISTPQGLAQALSSDLLMQTYILDGDIEQATMEKLNVLAKRDHHGNVIASHAGGRRRIDYIMPRALLKMDVLSYNAVTAFAGLTDHIAVFMEAKQASS